MKVSELIERLQELVENYGDLDIWLDSRRIGANVGEVTTADYDVIETEEGSSGGIIAVIAD